MFEDTYKTVETVSEGTFRDRGSKFIGYAYPLRDESQVKEVISDLKTLHPKARHHCWALRLTTDRSVFRVNDDGEPSGSAGKPILNTLLSADVTNILVVVVRYFGGTLLGVPGLINAYKQAAKEALDAAEIVIKTIDDHYRITFDYLLLNDVMRIVKEEGLDITFQEFDNRCAMEFSVRQAQTPKTLSRLESLSDIQIKFLRTL